jgi:hypothetical protein
MEEMTSSSWKWKGSSIVWSPELLGPLILAAEATPLREVLAWRAGNFPALPPAGGKTVLIGGLQTVLDTMPDSDTAYRWLRTNILPLCREAGKHWAAVSLVFAMDGPGKLFNHNDADDLVYYGRGTDKSKMILISRGIWNGAATGSGAFKLIAEEANEIGGYYVQRVS